jgi:hypothetical protein
VFVFCGGSNSITCARCRLWLVLTPDEIYYSVDKNHESKKTRIKLSECFEPTESSPCVFEIRTKKDKVLVVTCEVR